MTQTKTPETLKHPNVEIAVKNFGPIAEARIDLRPLTVFVGPSNTGKTYFSTLIYALHGIFDGFSQSPGLSRQIQTFGLDDLLHPGKTLTQIIRQTLDTSNQSFKLSDNQSFKLSDLPQKTQNVIQSEIKDSERLSTELKRCFDINSITELIRLKDGQRNKMNVSLKTIREKERLWHFDLKVSKVDITAHGYVNRNVALYAREWLPSTRKLSFEDVFVGSSAKLNKYIIKEKTYLPAARSGIMQSHRVIASSLVERATRGGLTPLEVPTFSGVVADFMQKLILYEESQNPDQEITRLAEVIESDVLEGQILMKPTPSGYPEFLYRPSVMGEEVRLTRAASMVSELAPVVLFLRSGICPGDTLIIEEPEAHLHPGAQTEIALILAGLVRAGVHVVVTTHSDWLLKEIANLIRIGDLKRTGVPKVEAMSSTHWLLPEEVGTWWFQKDGRVKPIPFDPTEGIEPRDYEDVADKLYDSSVNLQDLLEEVDRKNNEWD